MTSPLIDNYKSIQAALSVSSGNAILDEKIANIVERSYILALKSMVEVVELLRPLKGEYTKLGEARNEATNKILDTLKAELEQAIQEISTQSI